jgi:hypothetical protein
MIEEWKVIKDYPKYMISNLGRVKSFWFKKERMLKPTKHPMGYMYIVLYGNKKEKGKRFSIHRLILINFKPIENYLDLQCNHINGIKDDNRLENLEWCTSKENTRHAIKIGLMNQKGTNNSYYGKHHSEEIKKIISEKTKGMNHPLYGKHHSEESKKKISKANKNKYRGENSPVHKLTNEKVFQIRLFLKEGY